MQRTGGGAIISFLSLVSIVFNTECSISTFHVPSLRTHEVPRALNLGFNIYLPHSLTNKTKGWSPRSEAKKTSRATIPAAPPFVSSIRSKLLHTTSVGMRHRRHKKIASLHLSPLKRPHGTRAHTPRPQILVHGACVPFGRGFLSLDVSLAPFYFVALVSAGISPTRKSFSYTGMTGSCLPGAISASSPVLTVSSMSQ